MRRALHALIERESAHRLARLGGSEPALCDITRRRPEPRLILADTSVWIDHLRVGGTALARLLDGGDVLGRPWVVGELSLGHLGQRREIIGLLSSLPQATVATQAEVLTLIERHELQGVGIGYVDAQLPAATKLTPDATLWTTEWHLAAVTSRLGSAFDPETSGEYQS